MIDKQLKMNFYCNSFLKKASYITGPFDGHKLVPNYQWKIRRKLAILSYTIEFITNVFVLFKYSPTLKYYFGEIRISSSQILVVFTFCEVTGSIIFIFMSTVYEREINPPIKFRWLRFCRIETVAELISFLGVRGSFRFQRAVKIYYKLLTTGQFFIGLFLTAMILRSLPTSFKYLGKTILFAVPVLFAVQKIYNYRNANCACVCNYFLFSTTNYFLQLRVERAALFLRPVRNNTSCSDAVSIMRFLRSFNRIATDFRYSNVFFNKIFSSMLISVVAIIITLIHVLWFDSLSFEVFALLFCFIFSVYLIFIVSLWFFNSGFTNAVSLQLL